jgi:hypothetical protein
MGQSGHHWIAQNRAVVVPRRCIDTPGQLYSSFI